MNKNSQHLSNESPLLIVAIERLQEANIDLIISKKRVKNINFRLKLYQLIISAPMSISDDQLAQVVDKRVSWALTHHPQVVERYQRTSKASGNHGNQAGVLLWGERQSHTFNYDEKLAYYRQQLSMVMPELFAKWQPVVGAYANEIRIKKMQTRWGSCNTRARRIWLSVHLPAYPIECTEYVIVHELCHLHHANHSPVFWQTVGAAMPDYRHWHNMLAGKSGQLD